MLTIVRSAAPSSTDPDGRSAGSNDGAAVRAGGNRRNGGGDLIGRTAPALGPGSVRDYGRQTAPDDHRGPPRVTAPEREVTICAMCGRTIVFVYDAARDRARFVELGSDRTHDMTGCRR